METKELKITIPEGQEIDWQESAKQEKIVFKKKDTKPRSWEEYCKNNKDKQVWFVKEGSNIGGCHLMCRPINQDKNTLPTKELAEAFLAMMQLMSLRQAWIDDWKPEWNKCTDKYCITNSCSTPENLYMEVLNFKPSYQLKWFETRPLSFPTEEMAKDFMNCFKDLLEVAKPLV